MSLPADDLLSAFHDGEVNSAERLAVEQRLATSAEARRERSEIRQVSSLLKELPRECLPSEFPQQVLQAVEREMLIPSLRSEGPESLSKAGATRRWVGAVAVLTSAAGLLLLLRAVDDRPARGTSEVRQLAGSPTALSAPSESLRDASLGFGGGAVPQPMAGDVEAAGSRKSGVGGFASSNSVAADSSAAHSLPSAVVVARESNILFLDQPALRDHKIGDVVRAMQTEGTEVAVVWLTVVDRQEGLAGLQLLLANNRIARSNSNEKADRSEKPNASADQMYAVFVESDPEQLAAAVKQLRQESFLQSLEVDQPIELAQLDEVRAGLDPAMAKRRFAGPPSSAAEKKADKAAPTSTVAPKTTPAGAGKSLDANNQLAKQVTLELPREALVQNPLNQQTRNRGASRSFSRTRAVSEKDADDAPVEQRPMQVLFVVVDQSQAGKQPVSPNNSTKPTTPATPSKARSEPAKPADKDGAA